MHIDLLDARYHATSINMQSHLILIEILWKSTIFIPTL
jgi:hypothetical protein